MNKQKHIPTYFFFATLIAVLILTFFIFYPFLIVFLLAGTVAILLEPVFVRLKKILGGRQNIAAFLVIIGLYVVVLLPISFLFTKLFGDAQDLYTRVTSVDDAHSITALVQQFLHRIAPHITINISAYISQVSQWIVVNISSLFSVTLNFAFKLFIGTISLFYLLRDGAALKKQMLRLSPLPDEYDESIFSAVKNTIKSVLEGTIIIAIIQGIFTGIGLAVFGVPNPVLWGTVASMTALIPGLGTSLITMPSIGYLFIQGQTYPAIGMFLWAIFGIGMIDNFLSPHIVQRGLKVHPLLILFSIMGGLAFFGFEGFLLGPIVLSLLVALIGLYNDILKLNE